VNYLSLRLQVAGDDLEVGVCKIPPWGIYYLHMRVLLTFIVFASFIGIAVFGFFGMHAGMQNHNGGCMAATAQGVDCPKQGSAPEYFAFHLNAHESFSLATFSENSINSLLATFALLLAIGIALSSVDGLGLSRFVSSSFRLRNYFSPPAEQEIRRWLALHENSPAIS